MGGHHAGENGCDGSCRKRLSGRLGWDRGGRSGPVGNRKRSAVDARCCVLWIAWSVT